MAGRGRGRGRGRGGMSFNIETLGFGRGEALPSVNQEPPTAFPPLEYKPLPLQSGDEANYLLALKQECRATMRESPYYIKPPEKKMDIERYSDKYQLKQQENGEWKPDWSRFPPELEIRGRRKAKIKAIIKPKVPYKKAGVAEEDIKKHLEALEKKEGEDDVEETKSNNEEDKGEEEEPADEEALYPEEGDLEDDTDYNLTYFDNGENYGMDEDDDLDDGPTY